MNVSAGLLLAAYSLPICGPRLCGQVQGIAPGASARLDVFGPYLYVTDQQTGAKIYDEERLNDIRQRLIAAIEEVEKA